MLHLKLWSLLHEMMQRAACRQGPLQLTMREIDCSLIAGSDLTGLVLVVADAADQQPQRSPSRVKAIVNAALVAL